MVTVYFAFITQVVIITVDLTKNTPYVQIYMLPHRKRAILAVRNMNVSECILNYLEGLELWFFCYGSPITYSLFEQTSTLLARLCEFTGSPEPLHIQ